MAPTIRKGKSGGGVQFVCWVSPSRRRTLVRKFRVIRWDEVSEEAKRRGLVATKKLLTKRMPVAAVSETVKAETGPC